MLAELQPGDRAIAAVSVAADEDDDVDDAEVEDVLGGEVAAGAELLADDVVVAVPLAAGALEEPPEPPEPPDPPDPQPARATAVTAARSAPPQRSTERPIDPRLTRAC
jgi:hypothetical protein